MIVPVKRHFEIYGVIGAQISPVNTDYEEKERQLIFFSDLSTIVRISDELGKPILYHYQSKKSGICKFYVLHDREMYVFDIKANQDSGTNDYSTETKDLLESIGHFV
ncbi:MAG TPA: DUF5305 domain-containing protein [Clostridiaceae bacterium]|jgi:hypothetical protein|nr:DUF5305 domain-containing protein [Clostridiales bacterium]HHW21573.1 DUF5305 domain-containing protein [Clostridiaceae bacterium]